ncbi:hypothetical protein EYF80_014723 [Liparis tanakae]|uniref:Uncharacterized protein n=1 Tax=Liparis tanakae TaxID=230148 RepID=A0A4Z2IAG1_9TELE|nr:hypothetical protein EYF80_014723 [Liparis tanakae]
MWSVSTAISKKGLLLSMMWKSVRGHTKKRLSFPASTMKSMFTWSMMIVSPSVRAIQYHSRPKMNQLRVKEALKRKRTKRHRISTKVVQKSARKNNRRKPRHSKDLGLIRQPRSLKKRPNEREINHGLS